MNALNTEDTTDPDTQSSEAEAAGETVPHSNLHAARVATHLSESDRGSKDHTFTSDVDSGVKETVQKPVQPFT